MRPNQPHEQGHLLGVCNFEQMDALIPRKLSAPVGDLADYGAIVIGHQRGWLCLVYHARQTTRKNLLPR
jgi:hypothetical protein